MGSSKVALLQVYLITCLESKGWVANDKSFNNYAYLVFKQYSLPLTFRASSECAFKQHVQSIHWGATTILKWQVCNICQTLSERSKKVGDGICDLLLYLMLSPNKINVPYYLLFTIIGYDTLLFRISRIIWTF